MFVLWYAACMLSPCKQHAICDKCCLPWHPVQFKISQLGSQLVHRISRRQIYSCPIDLHFSFQFYLSFFKFYSSIFSFEFFSSYCAVLYLSSATLHYCGFTSQSRFFLQFQITIFIVCHILPYLIFIFHARSPIAFLIGRVTVVSLICIYFEIFRYLDFF